MRAVAMTGSEDESGVDDRPSAEGDQGEQESGADAAPGNYLKRFLIRSGHRIAVVRIADVDSIVSNGNYLDIRAAGKVHRLRSTLREVNARLNPSQFVRIHKSTIVNLDMVAEIQSWFGGDYIVVLKGGRQLRMSRTYARSLLNPMQ